MQYFFCIPAIFVFNNAFGNNHSKLYKIILNKDNFVVVFESKKCDIVKNTLESNGVSYFELNDEKAAIKVERV